MSFDTYLKNVRSKMNVNQTQMAEILDISRTAIKLIENGSTKYPSKKVLHNLSIYLNQSELDVMTKILFTDKILGDKSTNENFIRSYLTYMYLEGWNINYHPYVYPLWQGKSIEFDGKITKKRQPKNIIIVTTFKRELYRVKTVSSREDALAYMGDLVSKIMAVMDEFRGVQLLFNILNEEDYASFEVFKKLEFQKIIPKLEIVLFNPEIGEIKEKNRVGE